MQKSTGVARAQASAASGFPMANIMKWVAGPVNAHSAADRETPTRSRGLGFPTPAAKRAKKRKNSMMKISMTKS